MQRSTITLLLALLAFGLGPSCGSKAPAECPRLCSLREGLQRQTFKSFTVEMQFDLYIGCESENSCWRDSISPRDDFGRWMAEDNKAASFLTERLKAEGDERLQRGIIRILRLMAVHGHLKGERGIAEVVNRAVAGMDSDDERDLEQIQTWAKEIEGNTR